MAGFGLPPFMKLLAGYGKSNCHNYQFKAKHLSFPSAVKSKQNLWNTGELNELNFEQWQCWILSNLICDPPIVRGSSLRPKWSDCNEWDFVGKVNTLAFQLYHVWFTESFPEINDCLIGNGLVFHVESKLKWLLSKLFNTIQ